MDGFCSIPLAHMTPSRDQRSAQLITSTVSPSTPVLATTAVMSADVLMSPLANTGTLTLSFTYNR